MQKVVNILIGCALIALAFYAKERFAPEWWLRTIKEYPSFCKEKERQVAEKEFREYPKMVYPPGKPAAIVHNAEEEIAIMGTKENEKPAPKRGRPKRGG